MEAELVKVIIVNARNTDRFALIYEYSDGTQSFPSGSFSTVDAARADAERNEGDVEIEDGTIDE